MRHLFEIGRFLAVIEFVLERRLEFIQHFCELIAPADFRVAVEKGGHFLEHLEVFGALFTDARALHLHDHFASVAQCGAMDLPERCRREWLGVKCFEGLRNSHAELVVDDAFHILVWERLHFVLQAGQTLEVGFRQQIRATGE